MRGGARLRALVMAAALVLPAGMIGPGHLAGAISNARPAVDEGNESSAGAVLDFGLVSGGQGWIRSGGSLYWTDTDGRSWREISPADPNATALMDVFFLDARRGWAVMKAAGAGAEEWTLARTNDGGETWESAPLEPLSPQAAIAPVSAVTLHFVDERHGWLAAKHASSSNFSIGSLFRTADGGRTWTQLTLPIGEPVTFTDEKRGWTAGGAAGDELYRTVDGGTSWQAQEVTLAAGAAGERRFYRLPVFRNAREGLLAAGADGEHARLELYATGDGGDTWVLTAALPMPQGATADGPALALLPGGRPALIVAQNDRVVTASVDGEVTVSEAGLPAGGRITRLEMATPSAGWALASSGTCTRSALDGAGPGSGSEVVCRSETRLLGTTDGGRSWTSLELPQEISTFALDRFEERAAAGARPGGAIGPAQAQASRIAVMKGQAFDMCEITSLARLQTWFTQSPYRAVNLYIGGGARACSNAALSASLLAQLSGMGWSFIPTWVGPQAPCTSHSLLISEDPTSARAQGESEANKAADVAAALGLGPGTILYYDMEYYNIDNTTCHTAVQAFVEGWTSQVRARGSRAGVYGTSKPLNSFAGLAAVPDAIWPAYWNYSSYTASASVWDVGVLPNTRWNNHQRIHQYTGGHDETWGGVTLNIDCNVVDGVLASVGPPDWGHGVYLPLAGVG